MENLIATLVAQRYYLEHQTKQQIAEDLGISRFKVARILERAVQEGIVRFHVEAPPELELQLSRKLERRLGLRQALVITGVSGDESATRRRMGKVCAALLAERLSADDVLGVSWGRALHALTDVTPQLPAATVVQIVGSVPSADLNVNSLELVRRLGERTGGQVHALHVPMVLDSAEVAASLRASHYVAATLSRFTDLTCAVVGIGAWRAQGSSLRHALPNQVVRDLDDAGAVADICSTVLDAAGGVVESDAVPSRCIAITTDQLRQVPDVMALAGGERKAAAIAAAVRAGLVHRLIVDAPAATALLSS